MKGKGLNWTMIFVFIPLFFSSCTNFTHDNPYDPQAPEYAIKKASISGTILLEGSTDHSGTVVSLNCGTSASCTTQTDSSGNFTLGGIPPGTYTLIATHSDYSSFVIPSITLEIGQNYSLPEKIELKIKRGSISGTIQLKDSALSGGVQVTLTKVQSSSSSASLHSLSDGITYSAVTYSTLTGPDGSYVINDVPAGIYRLEAKREGYESVELDGISINDSAGYSIQVPAQVLLPLTGTLTINNGDEYTNSPTLVVTFIALNGASRMRVGTEDEIPSLEPVTYSASLTYVLSRSTPDGTVKICGQFENGKGDLSNLICDSIIYDTTPPGAPVVRETDNIYTNSDVVLLYLQQSADDANFDHYEKCSFTQNDTCDDTLPPGGSPWEKSPGTDGFLFVINYAGDGTYHLCVRGVDKAGNVGKRDCTMVIRDTTPPTKPSIWPRTHYLNNQVRADTVTYTLKVTSQDLNFDHYEIRGGESHAFVNAGTKTTFTFTLERGVPNYIEIRGVDKAGNAGEADMVSIFSQASWRASTSEVYNKAVIDQGRILWESSNTCDGTNYAVLLTQGADMLLKTDDDVLQCVQNTGYVISIDLKGRYMAWASASNEFTFLDAGGDADFGTSDDIYSQVPITNPSLCMELVKLDEKGRVVYVAENTSTSNYEIHVYSAGADGEFNTTDDTDYAVATTSYFNNRCFTCLQTSSNIIAWVDDTNNIIWVYDAGPDGEYGTPDDNGAYGGSVTMVAQGTYLTSFSLSGDRIAYHQDSYYELIIRDAGSDGVFMTGDDTVEVLSTTGQYDWTKFHLSGNQIGYIKLDEDHEPNAFIQKTGLDGKFNTSDDISFFLTDTVSGKRDLTVEGDIAAWIDIDALGHPELFAGYSSMEKWILAEPYDIDYYSVSGTYIAYVGCTHISDNLCWSYALFVDTITDATGTHPLKITYISGKHLPIHLFDGYLAFANYRWVNNQNIYSIYVAENGNDGIWGTSDDTMVEAVTLPAGFIVDALMLGSGTSGEMKLMYLMRDYYYTNLTAYVLEAGNDNHFATGATGESHYQISATGTSLRTIFLSGDHSATDENGYLTLYQLTDGGYSSPVTYNGSGPCGITSIQPDWISGNENTIIAYDYGSSMIAVIRAGDDNEFCTLDDPPVEYISTYTFPGEKGEITQEGKVYYIDTIASYEAVMEYDLKNKALRRISFTPSGKKNLHVTNTGIFWLDSIFGFYSVWIHQ